MCESDPDCEASQRDEFIIEKLKSAVSEIALSRNKLQDENQKLLQELKMYQRQCQVRVCAAPGAVPGEGLRQGWCQMRVFTYSFISSYC